MTGRLYSIMDGSSAYVVDQLLDVLLPDATTILDMTYGNGRFWFADVPRCVTGIDIDPVRAPHVVADFRALPFADGSFDVTIFDPPFHTDMGKGKASVMGARFKTFDSVADLEAAVEHGCAEAWRVARLGVIVKSQDYIHASRKVWMSRLVQDAMPAEPYDVVRLRSATKIVDPKWMRQLSVWSNNADFQVWRKDGLLHKARRAAS